MTPDEILSTIREAEPTLAALGIGNTTYFAGGVRHGVKQLLGLLLKPDLTPESLTHNIHLILSCAYPEYPQPKWPNASTKLARATKPLRPPNAELQSLSLDDLLS